MYIAGSNGGLTLRDRIRGSGFLVAGLFLLTLCPILVAPLYYKGWLDFSKDILSVGDLIALTLSSLLAGGLTLVAIHYSGITILDFYNFKRVGICKADPEFGLRAWEKDQFFASLVRNSKRKIILCGSSLSGWFRVPDHTQEFIKKLSEGVPITMLFLSPKSSNFRDREASEGEDATHKLAKRLYTSLNQLKSSYSELEPHLNSGKLRIFIYEDEPISLIIFDHKVFWFAYLPTVKNKKSPNLELETPGVFADKICEPVYELIENCEATRERQIKDAADLARVLSDLESRYDL